MADGANEVETPLLTELVPEEFSNQEAFENNFGTLTSFLNKTEGGKDFVMYQVGTMDGPKPTVVTDWHVNPEAKFYSGAKGEHKIKVSLENMPQEVAMVQRMDARNVATLVAHSTTWMGKKKPMSEEKVQDYYTSIYDGPDEEHPDWRPSMSITVTSDPNSKSFTEVWVISPENKDDAYPGTFRDIKPGCPVVVVCHSMSLFIAKKSFSNVQKARSVLVYPSTYGSNFGFNLGGSKLNLRPAYNATQVAHPVDYAETVVPEPPQPAASAYPAIASPPPTQELERRDDVPVAMDVE